MAGGDSGRSLGLGEDGLGILLGACPASVKLGVRCLAVGLECCPGGGHRQTLRSGLDVSILGPAARESFRRDLVGDALFPKQLECSWGFSSLRCGGVGVGSFKLDTLVN